MEENKPNNQPGKQPKQDNVSNRLPFSEWVKIVITNALITSVLLLVYHVKFTPPQVSVVDLKGFVTNLQNLYMQGKITQNEAKEKLDKAISIIQEEAKNTMVLSSDVVFGKNSKIKRIELPKLPDASPLDIFNSSGNNTGVTP